MRHGGQILIHQLKIQNCERVFCVPDVNMLPVLDGLYDNARLQTITCRNENSAALMAMAHGRLTNQPGICLIAQKTGSNSVLGATTIAQKDGVPLIIFVALDDDENEFDIRSIFQNNTKYMGIIPDTSRISEYVNRAYHIALSGKPGAVVIGLNANTLQTRSHTANGTKVTPTNPAPHQQDIQKFNELLKSANRPVMIVGGPSWSQELSENVQKFCENFQIPIITANSSQDYINNKFTHYSGYTENKDNPKLLDYLEQSDLIIGLGINIRDLSKHASGRIKIPHSEQRVIHIHPDANELGHYAIPTLSITSSASAFVNMLTDLNLGKSSCHWKVWTTELQETYRKFIKPSEAQKHIELEYMARVLNDSRPDNSIICLDKGSYCHFLSRYIRYEKYGQLLTTTCNTADFAIPAAISAKLNTPEKNIIAVTGDAGFLSSSVELATAKHYGLNIIVIIINNNMLGAINMQQEKNYPGRTIGTTLTNPDFIKLAESFEAHAEIVKHRKDFRAALKQAVKSNKISILEYCVSS